MIQINVFLKILHSLLVITCKIKLLLLLILTYNDYNPPLNAFSLTLHIGLHFSILLFYG